MTSWVQATVYGLGGYEAGRPDRVPWRVLNGLDPNGFAAAFRLSRTVEGFSKSFAGGTSVAGLILHAVAELRRRWLLLAQ
jgi:hypothetical protein